MEGSVPWAVFAWVSGGGATIIGICFAYVWHCSNKAKESDDLLHSRVSSLGRRHDDYREIVAEKYVRHEHLQASEQRLTSELAGVRSDIKDQTRSVDRLASMVHRLAGSQARSDEPQ